MYIYICNRQKKYTMYCSLMFKKWNRYVFKFHLVEALVMSIKNLHEYLWSNCAFNMTHDLCSKLCLRSTFVLIMDK